MTASADSPWDEQDQYEWENYKEHVERPNKELELVPKEERLQIHDGLGRLCKQELERLQGEESYMLQRKFVVMKASKKEKFGVVKALELLLQFAYFGLPENKMHDSDGFSSVTTLFPGGVDTNTHKHFSSDANSCGAEHRKMAVNTKTSASWIVATAAPHHATGNRNLLSGIVMEHDDLFVHAGDRVPMKVLARGAVVTDTVVMPDKGFVRHYPNAKGNRVRKNIFVITRTSNEGSSLEGTGSTLTEGNNHQRGTDSASNGMPEVILDNQAQVNCTGIFDLFCRLDIGPNNIVLVAANREEMGTFISGSVRFGNFELHDVHYCPDLGDRIIVSGSKLEEEGYAYGFIRKKFSVTDLWNNGRIVGEGRLIDGNYILDYLKIPKDRTAAPEQRPGLVTSAWSAVCSVLRRLGLKSEPAGAGTEDV